MEEADQVPGTFYKMIMSPRTRKEFDQVAALLKGDLDMPEEWTDEQIINRVYRHFGSGAICFSNAQWIGFVRSLFQSDR